MDEARTELDEQIAAFVASTNNRTPHLLQRKNVAQVHSHM